MDNTTYGLTMALLGMGGTIATLWVISLVMNLMKKLFPRKPDEASR
jgi:hypothetical protein